MRDRSDRYRVQPIPAITSPKRLGSYLVDAGLLTPDQIRVVLSDQQSTGMRFGEIVVARGWIREQTIEWIVQKVIEPERQTQPEPSTSSTKAQAVKSVVKVNPAVAARASLPVSEAKSDKSQRRDLPISKPLPSVNSADNEVNWVG